MRFGDVEDAQPFHSLEQADYVTVLAVTSDGRVPLVEQYRPAVERVTVELPGGLREGDEDPRLTAVRELYEETGCRPGGEPVLLGSMLPDTGRLENRLWCYAVADAARDTAWRPEPRCRLRWTTVPGLIAAVENGTFDFAQHVAIVCLAMLKGLIGSPDAVRALRPEL